MYAQSNNIMFLHLINKQPEPYLYKSDNHHRRQVELIRSYTSNPTGSHRPITGRDSDLSGVITDQHWNQERPSRNKTIRDDIRMDATERYMLGHKREDSQLQ